MDLSRFVWVDRATGKLTVQPPRGNFFNAAFSADGKQFATAGEEDACVFDTATGKQISACKVQKPHSGWHVDTVSFNLDGSKLAASSAGFIRLHETATGKPLTPKLTTEEDDWLEALLFSRDGKTVFAAGCGFGHLSAVWAAWDVDRVSNSMRSRGSAGRNVPRGALTVRALRLVPKMAIR